MEELREKANSYVEENVNNILKEVFAKVYADGYREGYKDREAEIPVDLHDNNKEYVDLGLPSGTLWASDYERIGDKLLYLPYDKAITKSIPTEEQWRELYACKWAVKSDKLYCIGPNGNMITFIHTGYESVKDIIEIPEWSFMWLRNIDKKDDTECSAAKMSWYISYNIGTNSTFRGYSLPIRLVCNK